MTGIYDVRDYGAKGDGTTDDIAAFEAALAAMGPAPTRDPYNPAAIPGGQLRVPQGVYRLTRTLHVGRSCTIRGDSGKGWFPGTVLQFDPGICGVVFDWVLSSQAGGRGDWSLLADVAVRSGGVGGQPPPRWEASKTYAVGDLVLPTYYVEFGYAYRCKTAGASGATEPAWPSVYPPPSAPVTDGSAGWDLVQAHGVVFSHGCTTERVAVQGFAGNAFHVLGSYALTPPTSASSWRVLDCFVEAVGGCGVYVAGDDSSVGVADGVEILRARGWGVRDRSFLSSSYRSILLEDCESGPFYSVCSTLLDCYVEGGGGANVIQSSARWIGGVAGGSAADGFSSDYRPPWKPSTVYAPGAYVTPGNGWYYVARTGGTSGTTPPVWPAGPHKSVVDAGVVWNWYGTTEPGGGTIDGASNGFNSPRLFTNRSGARGASLRVAQGPDVPFAWGSSDDTSEYAMAWEPYERGWSLRHAYAGDRSPLYLTAEGHWRGPGQLVLPRGMVVGAVPGEGSQSVRELAGTAPPTGAVIEQWRRGDRVRNAAPSVGDPEGWVCTRDGAAAPAWTVATAYAVGARVVPPVDTGCYYVCVQAGTSGATPPTWPSVRGQTVADGGAVWHCGSTAPAWTPDAVVAYGALVRAEPDITHYWRCWRPGTTGSTQPTWTGPGGTFVIDGTARWNWAGRSAQAALWTPYGKVGPQ